MSIKEEKSFPTTIRNFILSVPVRWKILGIGILPVIILGFSLNYWIVISLADWLSYFLSDSRVDAAMQAGERSVFLVTIMAAILSILLLLLLVRLLTKPLEELRNTAEEVASGKFNTRAVVWANDEIGSLAISVNKMIDNLVTNRNELSIINQQLTGINRISSAADDGKEIHDVLYIALENILNILNLETGWIYLFDPEIGKYHLASWKGIPEYLKENFLHHKEMKSFDCIEKLKGEGYGVDLERRSCSCLKIISPTLESLEHLTIPIEARNINFGLINILLSPDKIIENNLLEFIPPIGRKISEVVANAWFDIKLKEKEISRQLLLQSLVTAQESERSHLARELHDQAGQSLTNLLIRIKTIEKQCDNDNLKFQLNESLDFVSNIIDEIRDLSYSLRPPSLEQFGIGAAIRALAEEISSQSKIEINIKDNVDVELPHNIENVLYRIVQEGLTNIVRHSEASKVLIEFNIMGKAIFVKIEDNGKGFSPNLVGLRDGKQHLGLISMNERAELIGGNIKLSSSLGEGTVIEISVNIPELLMENYYE
jgi:signal transduction histidine kinase